MSDTFQCGDNATLVGYVYDECDPSERAAIDAHLAVCAACAAELAALQSTRMRLASWTAPAAELGFVISRAGATLQPLRSSEVSGARPEARTRAAWLAGPLPVWAQLAAAAVIFATGLALGIARPSSIARAVLSAVEGRGARPAEASADRAPAVAAVESASPAAAESVSASDLTALERRLRGEIALLRAGGPTQESPIPATLSEPQLLARVRALIDESEQRQQRELALRTAQIVRDFDAQRRVDLEQIERTFGQIEGLTGAEAREQRQMLNYLLRVSQQR